MRAFLILLFAAPLAAQTCKLPPTASGDRNTKIPLVAESDGANVTYLLPDKGITLTHGGEFGGDSKQAIVFACEAGIYRVWALSAKANIISPLAECIVTIGGVVPPPPPPPPPDTVKVPDVVGMDFATASATLKAANLAVLTIGDRAGIVKSQAPLAGSSTTPGSAVTLIMAAAAKPKPVHEPPAPKPPASPAKPRPAVGEIPNDTRPPSLAWGPGVPFPAGMQRYERDGFTQLLRVGDDLGGLLFASKITKWRVADSPMFRMADHSRVSHVTNVSQVSIDRLPEKFRVSGGMEGLTGWVSTKYRMFPTPPEDQLALLPLEGGVKLSGLTRSYSDGTRFDDVLSNEASGKVFEHRSRTLAEDKWTNAVLFRDAKEAPEGYNVLGLKACAACHKHSGSGEAGKPLIAGGREVFSDALAWNLLRK